MTCIVGVVEKGRVVIGGDSAGVAGALTQARRDAKVFRRGPFLIGFTTSFRMGQLLRTKLDAPERAAEVDAWEYLATEFVDAVRACLKAGGYARQENQVESGGYFLVGYVGRLFEIGSDYQVAEMLDGYTAVGCGAEIALGALHASAGLPAEARARRALEAAAHFSTGVRPPFVIETQACEASGGGRGSWPGVGLGAGLSLGEES